MSCEPITYAYLETTNYCNLDCVFCNRRDVVSQETLKHMSLENWDRILNILAPHPINEAKLMGLGEPFFHPYYDQITLRFKETFPKAFVISATNLQYKINDKFFKASQNLDLLYLSIDGYKETYEAARPGSKWARLINSLDEIQKRITSFKINTRFEINFVATPDTIHSLDNVYKIYEDYDFITDIRVNLAQWWGEDEKLELDYSSDYLSILRKYKDKVKGKAPWDFKDCFWPKRGIYMTVDGSVKVCCINTSTSPIGNIFLDDLDEMRQKSKLNNIRNDLINNVQDNTHCKTCSYKVLSPVLDKIIN